MIDPKMLAGAFERNLFIVRRQAEGLTDEQALQQAPFRANCLNWVVGHIAANRDTILGLLGEQPRLAGAGERYRRESEPIMGPGEGVLPLSQLLDALRRSQEALTAGLSRLTEADYGREVVSGGRQTELAKALFFLYFHETYHTGQTELLRQLAGVNDKVI